MVRERELIYTGKAGLTGWRAAAAAAAAAAGFMVEYIPQRENRSSTHTHSKLCTSRKIKITRDKHTVTLHHDVHNTFFFPFQEALVSQFI